MYILLGHTTDLMPEHHILKTKAKSQCTKTHALIKLSKQQQLLTCFAVEIFGTSLVILRLEFGQRYAQEFIPMWSFAHEVGTHNAQCVYST